MALAVSPSPSLEMSHEGVHVCQTLFCSLFQCILRVCEQINSILKLPSYELSTRLCFLELYSMRCFRCREHMEPDYHRSPSVYWPVSLVHQTVHRAGFSSLTFYFGRLFLMSSLMHRHPNRRQWRHLSVLQWLTPKSRLAEFCSSICCILKDVVLIGGQTWCLSTNAVPPRCRLQPIS